MQPDHEFAREDHDPGESAARVRHWDGTSYPAGMARWKRVVWAILRPINRWSERGRD